MPAGEERHVTAGPRALEAVGGLLGVGGGWRLAGLCAGGEPAGLRADLRNGAHRLAVLILPPGAPDAAAGTAGLSLSVEPDTPASRRLLQAAVGRLGARTHAELLALVEADPDSFVERLPAGAPGDRVRVPCVGQPIALLEDGWRNFYADQDFEVLLAVPSCSADRTVNVEYADLECFYSRPRFSHKKWTFLDWPEESDDGARSADGQERGANIVAELEERDMILGTGERADALVDEVKRRAAKGDYLLFTHLCTPIVMGEDLQGLARRCEKEVGGQAVPWTQKDRDSADNFGTHLRALFARPGFLDGEGDAAAVNLLHFPKPVREAELAPFLRELGLETNAAIFPDVNLPDFERLPKARWQVFCERSAYPTKLRDLFEKTPRRVATVPAPYGLEGTRECLRSVAAATGRDALFAPAWERRFAAFAPEWDRLRARAAGHRLAFVVSEATLPRLLGLRYGHGAPLARMAAEMGFGIDLLYYDRHGDAPAPPAGLEGARVSAFRAPWELRRQLVGGAFDAVYSDVFFDRRVAEAGKARFSSRDFEMGLDGVRRTLERLLAVCGLPFYKRYAAHLRPPEAA